jgi:hypothetical protein
MLVFVSGVLKGGGDSEGHCINGATFPSHRWDPVNVSFESSMSKIRASV